MRLQGWRALWKELRNLIQKLNTWKQSWTDEPSYFEEFRRSTAAEIRQIQSERDAALQLGAQAREQVAHPTGRLELEKSESRVKDAASQKGQCR